MADGRPLSSEIRDALRACRELRALSDNGNPFGPRMDADRLIADIERLLNTILRAIAT